MKSFNAIPVILTSLLLGALSACGTRPPPPRPVPVVVAPPPPTFADKCHDAEAAWKMRDQEQEARRAIAIWQEALAMEPQSEEVMIRLAEAHHFIAQVQQLAAGDNTAAHTALEAGLTAAEQALLRLAPSTTDDISNGQSLEAMLEEVPKEAQPALFWYAANLSGLVEGSDLATGLLLRDRLLKVMERVVALDPSFQFGGPHRILAVFFSSVPPLLGGDLGKAREHFELALSVDPRPFSTKVLFAELYATKSNDRELFTRLLDEVLAGDAEAVPELAPEQRLQQQRARHLVEEADTLFD